MSCINQSDCIDVLSYPITASTWIAVLEFVCQCIVAPHLNADNEHRICATVCHHIKPSPKQKYWIEEYKSDKDTNLVINYLSTSTPPAPQELISNVDHCYRMHLR